MVSDAFLKVTDQVTTALVLHDDLVSALAYALKQEKQVIERVLYMTSVATGHSPVDIAFGVHEFFWRAQ